MGSARRLLVRRVLRIRGGGGVGDISVHGEGRMAVKKRTETDLVHATSDLENNFMFRWRVLRGPEFVREFKFHKKRKWRFDFAWPKEKVAIEIEGGIWSGGRHTRGFGFEKDCEKYNEATISGWRVFRITGKTVKNDTSKIIDRIVSLLTTQGDLGIIK